MFHAFRQLLEQLNKNQLSCKIITYNLVCQNDKKREYHTSSLTLKHFNKLKVGFQNWNE